MTRGLDATLQNVTSGFLMMQGVVMQQVTALRSAIKVGQFEGLESRVLQLDAEVDGLEQELQEICLRGLALQSPVARDLRLMLLILTSLSDIERAGDYAKHVARQVAASPARLNHSILMDVESSLVIVAEMISQLAQAFADRDLQAARQVILLDEQMDAQDEQMQRLSLVMLMEQPGDVGVALYSSRLGRDIERLGDHLKNVAERILADASSMQPV